jgi:hypothetical protein
MRRLLFTLSLLSTLSLGASSAWADIKVDPPTVSAPLVMKYEKGAKTHRLTIPKKLLAGVKLSQLDASDAGQAEVSLAGDNGRTILAGCALSMAVGSMVFFRRRQMAAAVVLVAGTLVLASGSIGWADFAVDPPKQTVVIEIVEKGTEVIFTLPAPAQK